MTRHILALVTVALAVTSQSRATPPDRHHHAVTYDPATRRIVTFGGTRLDDRRVTVFLDDLWSWNGQEWSPIAEATGHPVSGHYLFANRAGVMFAIGGKGGAVTRWNGRRWLGLAESMPHNVVGAAAAYDSRRDRYVMVAGSPLPGETSDQMWESDGTRWHHIERQAGAVWPPAVIGAAMAYDRERRVMVLFGGRDAARQVHGSTWTWDGKSWAVATTTGPAARAFHGMAFDSRRDEVVLFGGRDGARTEQGDTWLWDGTAWRSGPAAGPPPRTEPMMAFDDARGVTVMFGGSGSDPNKPTFGDTWEWDGAQWRAAPGR